MLVQKDLAANVSPHLDYVLSDESVDRYGDIVDQRDWQLKDFLANPVALFGHDQKQPIGRWVNVRVEGGRLLGRLELLKAGISQRVDEIRGFIEQGILRAVSVGFRPNRIEPLKSGTGKRYLSNKLVEVSLVSVPANANTLQIARACNLSAETISTIFGKSADEDAREVAKPPGESADPSSLLSSSRISLVNIPLAKRIEDSQARFNAARDALNEHVLRSGDGVMDDVDVVATDELSARVAAEQRTLDALKGVERSLALNSEPVMGGGPRPTVPATARKPFGLPSKDTKPGDLFIRSVIVHAQALAQNRDVEDVLRLRYGDDEATGMVVRAAVAGATTTAAGWAAELVNTVMTDFIETLRPVSVYPGLAAAGGGRLNFGPNQGAIKIPSRAATPSIGGSFVGEGAPIPVRRLGLGSVTLSPRKMAVISVFSREIARYSTPAIEGLLRREITNDTAITLDSLLLDNVAASAVRPAGLLAGVTTLTPTAGGGNAAILGDIRKLRTPFDTALAGTGLVLLMNPAQLEGLALTPGPDGTIGWADGIMARYNPLVSTAIPAGRVIMVRAADFATATGDAPEFELSEQALLHMEDTTPLQIGTVGTPTSVAAPAQSMFQTAQTALRMLMDVSWAMTRPGMVQFIDPVTW